MENQIVPQKERNYGIDLLKITAMFFIVCWHLMVHGSGLNLTENWIFILSKSVFVCGVDCFALSSGYVLSDIKYKPHRIMVHWLQVAVYSIAIMLFFICFYPDTVSQQEAWHFFLPLRYDSYWYFSAYFILYLFIPFYNAVLNSLSKRNIYLFVVMLILVFSVLNFGRMQKYFYLSGGYSFWWLSMLYIIGGVIKKYVDVKKYKTKFLITGLVLCIILTFLCIFSKKIYFISVFLNVDSFAYNNIFIVLSSIFLTVLFTKITVKNTFIQKVVATISGLTFGVYLIHDHFYIREYVFFNCFTWLSELNPFVNILTIIGIALVIFICCLIIDCIRTLLFKLFKVNFLCEKLCNFALKKINKFTEKIVSI